MIEQRRAHLIAGSAAVAAASRVGLVTLGVGFLLATVGQFGGEWLGFPRSGNWLILPGTLLTTVGLVGFAFGVRDRVRCSPETRPVSMTLLEATEEVKCEGSGSQRSRSSGS